MNWVLVRKDPALRLLGFVLIATALIGLTFRLPTLFVSEPGGMMMDTLTQIQITVLGSCLFFCGLVSLDPRVSLRTRVLEFHQPLPVAAHELVRSRLPGLLALGWLPLWLCTMILWPNHSRAASQLALFALSSSLTWSAWIGMSLACQPDRPKGPHALIFAGLTIGTLAMAIAAFGRPLVVAPIAGGITLLTFRLLGSRRRQRFAEPRTLQIPPHLRSAFESRWQPSVMLPPLQHWLQKSTLGIPSIIQPLVAGVFVAALGLLWPLVTLLILPSFILAAISPALPLLESMGHLPIPRRIMARWVLLPPLLLLATGTVIGERIRQAWHTPEIEAVELGTMHSGGTPRTGIVVPARLWRLQLGSQAVSVVAPWGEAASLRPVPMGVLLPGLYAMNPYGTAQDSSVEFVAWQLSRALGDVREVEISAEQMKAHYLKRYGKNLTSLGVRDSFAEDYPPTPSSPAGDRTPLMLLAALVSWAAAGAWATRKDLPFRSGHSLDKWRQRLRCSRPTILMALLLPLPFLYGNWRAPHLSEAVAMELQRATESSPWIVSFAFLLAFAILFRFLSRRFERMEPPLTLESVWVDKLP